MVHTYVKRFLLAVVGLAVVIGPLSDLHPTVRGSAPMNHLLVPYGFEEKDIPDLRGKVFLVTGANSGVGWGTSKVLAKKGATVYMACRSLDKCEAAKQKIVTELKGAARADQLICEKLDLTSLKAVQKYAQQVRASDRRVDSLILNAGIMYPPFELTEDGLESTWGVNHVAHTLLTYELIPLLRKSPKATIVAVASNAHYFNLMARSNDVTTFNDPETYNVAVQYGRSKLANIFFAQEMAKKVGPNILINSLNPGGVRGNLYRHVIFGLRQILEFAMEFLFWSEEQSALTVIGCAWNPKLFDHHISGKYFVPVWREDAGSAEVRNATLSKLWMDETDKILKQKGFL